MSQNKALRTLETTAESIVSTQGAAPRFLETALSSIVFPGVLEVVVIYRDMDLGSWPLCSKCKPDPFCVCNHLRQDSLNDFPRQLRTFRRMHRARKFRLVLCVDVHGCMDELGMRLLESAIKKEEARGGFTYLDSGPVITRERRTIRTYPNDEFAGARSTGVSASAL